MNAPAQRFWLMKSEPDAFSLDDLRNSPRQTAPWDGVRNYQARNLMRDEMQAGDGVLFYHSRVPSPAVVGLARVARAAYPDHTQFDPASKYYDAKATRESPRWFMVDVQFEAALAQPVSLAQMKTVPALADMVLLRKGSRLSVQPVTEAQWAVILALGGAAVRTADSACG